MQAAGQANSFFLIFYKKSLASRSKMSIIAPLPRQMWKCERGCSSVVERNLAKVDVVGSNPIIRSHKKKYRGCSSVVERNLAKVDVVGSNPIIRSHKKNIADVAQW